MLGEPKTMQIFPSYQDVVAEVSGFLCERVRIAERAGIDRSKIIVDPGIGFGKNLSHNLQLLNGLERLTPIGAAVMVGPSRKSFVGAILGTEAGDRLEGTLAAVAHAVVQGVGFVRVHDVRQVKRTVRVIEAILEAGGK
jgi:dihydropteroate synthase